MNEARHNNEQVCTSGEEEPMRVEITDAMVEAAIRVPWITVAGQRADARRILEAALNAR